MLFANITGTQYKRKNCIEQTKTNKQTNNMFTNIGLTKENITAMVQCTRVSEAWLDYVIRLSSSHFFSLCLRGGFGSDT